MPGLMRMPDRVMHYFFPLNISFIGHNVKPCTSCVFYSKPSIYLLVPGHLVVMLVTYREYTVYNKFIIP